MHSFIKLPISSYYYYNVSNFISRNLSQGPGDLVLGYSSISSLYSLWPIPGGMASSSSTLDSPSSEPAFKLFPLPGVLFSKLSRGCSYSGGLPFSDTSREPFLDYPSKKHPLLFFLIENIIFSFRACIIICNYIHVCAYLVNLCLLHKD